MSKEVKLVIDHILESKKPIPKQIALGLYHDALCYGLPQALAGRRYSNTEGARVVQFLHSLCYDFQFADTIRAIFVRKNSGEIEPEWVMKIIGDGKNIKFFWKQLDAIASRIRDTSEEDRQTLMGSAKALLIKLRKGMWDGR